ncbi:SRPBCC family protein [uncultured Litoreibacter sp.]|uniref:SRPBCC family protein n=1 Tax=uncultured Litoreibacter sp. TaxID=1392394 RepID=UPI00262EDDB5|nr:SRPBCC family protein [uncultured Litoreibacter sp.]
MKFSTKEDLEVPINDVFDMLSDFEGFERAAMRHGAEISRLGSANEAGVGLAWRVKAQFRGKKRDFEVTLSEFDRPNHMIFDATSNNMKGAFLVELVALSRNRTRMRAELDVRPKSLSARLLMQSAKLARNTLNRRYKTRIAHFAEDLEDRHKRGLEPRA